MRKRYYSRRRKANIRNIVLTVLALGALAALVFFGVRALQGRQGGGGTVQPTPTVAALATPTPAPTPPPAAVTPGLNENTAFTGERTIIRMEIVLDSENNTLSCIEEVTWRNDSEKALSEVVFRIFPNALKDDGDLPIGNSAKAFPQGANFEGVKFTRAMLGAEPLTYTMDGKYSTTLRAQMPESLEPGESATFLFAWKMDVPKGFFPLSYSATGSQNSWFYLQPAQYDGSKWLLTDIAKTGNPWFNESADYECVVRVDSKLGFASTGDVESTVDVGEMRVYTIRARSARNFAFATTSHSRMTTQQTESVTVTAYSAYNEKANLMAGRAVDILNYYTPILGDYPGNTLEIVQANLSEEAVVQDGLIRWTEALCRARPTCWSTRLPWPLPGSGWVARWGRALRTSRRCISPWPSIWPPHTFRTKGAPMPRLPRRRKGRSALTACASRWAAPGLTRPLCSIAGIMPD